MTAEHKIQAMVDRETTAWDQQDAEFMRPWHFEMNAPSATLVASAEEAILKHMA